MSPHIKWVRLKIQENLHLATYDSAPTASGVRDPCHRYQSIQLLPFGDVGGVRGLTAELIEDFLSGTVSFNLGL